MYDYMDGSSGLQLIKFDFVTGGQELNCHSGGILSFVSRFYFSLQFIFLALITFRDFSPLSR